LSTPSPSTATASEPPVGPGAPRAQSLLPTPFATFQLRVYEDTEGKEHLAITLGDLHDIQELAPLVRVHSECLTGDALFSLRCDCGFQLEHALQRIAVEQRGALLYLRQEGRGIGLVNKIRAYALQDQGHDTVEANVQLGFPPDARDYDIALRILKDLGVVRARLMTNNPRKIKALEAAGIEVTDRVPIECGRNPHNDAYLATKVGRLGHLMSEKPGWSTSGTQATPFRLLTTRRRTWHRCGRPTRKATWTSCRRPLPQRLPLLRLSSRGAAASAVAASGLRASAFCRTSAR